MKRFFIRTRLTNFAFLLSLLGVGIAGVHCTGAGGGGAGPIESPLTNPQAALNPSGVRTGGGEENPQDQKKVAFILNVSTPDGRTNCNHANSESEAIFTDDKNPAKLDVLFGFSKSKPLSGPKELASVGTLGKIRFNPDCPIAVFKNQGVGNAPKAFVVDTATVVATLNEGDKRFQTEPLELPCDAKPQDTPKEICLTLKPESEVSVLLENLIPIEEPPSEAKIIILPTLPDDSNGTSNLRNNIDTNIDFNDFIHSIHNSNLNLNLQREPPP